MKENLFLNREDNSRCATLQKRLRVNIYLDNDQHLEIILTNFDLLTRKYGSNYNNMNRRYVNSNF